MIVRSIVLFIAMAASAAMAYVLTPTALYSKSHYGNYSLDKALPRSFGDWRLEDDGSRTVVSPTLQQELDKYYNETLSRTYINSKGERVMLSLAYGGDQGRSLQVHKPEVCYEAQGFKIVFDGKGTLPALNSSIPVRRLVATHGLRTEPITYWIRSGDAIVTGWYEQNKARIKAGLFDGQVADGLLVRVSNLTTDREAAFKLHDQFMTDLIAHTKTTDHDMLLGSSYKLKAQ